MSALRALLPFQTEVLYSEHTSAGWYRSQVAQGLQTSLILQTPLVFRYSVFSILPLCRFQSLSLFSRLLSLSFSKLFFM